MARGPASRGIPSGTIPTSLRRDRDTLVAGGELGPSDLAAQHVIGDEEEEDPASDFEGGESEPEGEEQEASHQGEGREDDAERDYRAAEHGLTVLRLETFGERDEERQGPDRVDEGEDGDNDGGVYGQVEHRSIARAGGRTSGTP